MDSQNAENLKELFEKFAGTQEAEQAVEDIEKGEQILRRFAAPEPEGQVIAYIKNEVAAKLARRRANAFKKKIYKWVSAAAAVIALAVVGVGLFVKGGDGLERIPVASVMPKLIWDSEDINANDAGLAILNAEVEQVEREILALQIGENEGNGGGDTVNLETELIGINSDFWKG